MKFHFLFLWVLVLVVGAVDWLLWRIWTGDEPLRGFRKWLMVGTFIVSPIVFLIGFFIFGFLVPEASGPGVYNAFSGFLTLFLLIYLPKFVFLIVYGIGKLPMYT